jgi:hypothetical protein
MGTCLKSIGTGSPHLIRAVLDEGLDYGIEAVRSQRVRKYGFNLPRVIIVSLLWLM